MPVVLHPPHRSRRAELPLRAPASGFDAKALFLLPPVPSPAHYPGVVWHCVQPPFCMDGFPLANPLLSTFSAACLLSQALFKGFTDTMELSDSLRPFIMAGPLWVLHADHILFYGQT